MRNKTRHLLHLAGLALLFYGFAMTGRAAGATVAIAIFLPLGMLFECRFWWQLLTSDREEPRRPSL